MSFILRILSASIYHFVTCVVPVWGFCESNSHSEFVVVPHKIDVLKTEKLVGIKINKVVV